MERVKFFLLLLQDLQFQILSHSVCIPSLKISKMRLTSDPLSIVDRNSELRCGQFDLGV